MRSKPSAPATAGGGVEVFYSVNGQVYMKDIVIPETVTGVSIYQECDNLEKFSHLGATSYPINCLYNCKNLREVYFPKLTKLDTSYLIRQQGGAYNKLETVVIGSIGYPVTEITQWRWRYGSHAMVLNVTIYVDYSSIADIPTTITQNAQGDNVYAPTGSVVNVIYRNSTTGEILS